MTTVNKNTSGWNGDNRDPWGGSSNNQRHHNFENQFWLTNMIWGIIVG